MHCGTIGTSTAVHIMSSIAHDKHHDFHKWEIRTKIYIYLRYTNIIQYRYNFVFNSVWLLKNKIDKFGKIISIRRGVGGVGWLGGDNVKWCMLDRAFEPSFFVFCVEPWGPCILGVEQYWIQLVNRYRLLNKRWYILLSLSLHFGATHL